MSLSYQYFLGRPIRRCFKVHLSRLGQEAYENPNIIKAKYDLCTDCLDGDNPFMAIELTDCTDPANIVYINHVAIPNVVIGDVYEIDWFVIPLANDPTGCFTVTDIAFFIGVLDGFINKATKYDNCSECAGPPTACPYASFGDGESSLTVELDGWSGDFERHSSLATGTAVAVADSPGSVCSGFFEPVVWDYVVPRATFQSGAWSIQFTLECYWEYTTASPSSIFNGHLLTGQVRAGYQAGVGTWVATTRHSEEFMATSCLDVIAIWIKDGGNSPVGTYRPATQAELTTMGVGASSSHVVADDGTLVIT